MKQTILVFLAICLSFAQAQEPGFENLENEGEDSAVQIPAVTDKEQELIQHLKRVATWEANSFRSTYTDDRAIVFQRFSNPFISKRIQEDRDSTENNGYLHFVRNNLQSDVVYRGFSLDGEKSYLLSHKAQELQTDVTQVQFKDSMLTGFVYLSSNFPLMYAKIREAYKEDAVWMKYRQVDGKVQTVFELPKGEVLAYLFLCKVEDKREVVVVLKKSLDQEFPVWEQKALETTFYKYFVYDNQEEILTTNEVQNFNITIRDLGNDLWTLRNAAHRTYRTGRENWFNTEYGKYIDYSKKWRDHDHYRYKNALATEVKKIEEKLNADHTSKHAALIFGQNRVQDAHRGAIRQMSYCYGKVSSTGWQDTISDHDPGTSVLEPFTTGKQSLNTLRSALTEESRILLERYTEHVNEEGLVTLGFMNYDEVTAFEPYSLDEAN